MIGSDIWMVTIDGGTFKGGLTRKEAEAIAERYQRGLCKHKDHRLHVEIKRDVTLIKDFEERYQVAKRGERQVHKLYLGS